MHTEYELGLRLVGICVSTIGMTLAVGLALYLSVRPTKKK